MGAWRQGACNDIFKTPSDRYLNLILAVPGSTSRLVQQLIVLTVVVLVLLCRFVDHVVP